MRDERQRDHAGVGFPPPAIYAAGFLLGWVAHLVTPLPALPRTIGIAAGSLFLLLGAVLLAAGARRFLRAGTALPPHRPSTALVTGGPYRFSRNPIYLGFGLVHGGVALLAGITWALIALVPVMVVVDRAVVSREERYLERKFGSAYTDYRTRVRRWL